MKVKSIIDKPHGLKEFTFTHMIKKEEKEIVATAMNEAKARVKAWGRVSELYKEQKTNGSTRN